MPLVLMPKMKKLLCQFSRNTEKKGKGSHQNGIMINTLSEVFDDLFFQVYEKKYYTFRNRFNEYKC